PACADHQQREDEQQHAPAPVVAAHARGGQHLVGAAAQVEPAEIPADQLQAAVRRKSLRDELNRAVCLDWLPQHPYPQSPSTGLLGGESWVGTHTLFTTGEALFIGARGLNPRE